MAENLIPEAVREFIASHIDSVAELEALLLLRRDQEIKWSVGALAERLYISEEQAEGVATSLCSLALAVVADRDPVTYQYRPSSLELDDLISSLAEAYSRYLIPVTNLIHAKPQSRVQEFADAFKLKRRDENK
jgi:hypothetical protein